MAAWLKKMPYQNARRMKFDAEALDEVVVKCIEDVLDSHKVKKLKRNLFLEKIKYDKLK